MLTFEVGGKKYTADMLDAMRQFHILRRMAPILAGLLPAGVALKDMQSVLQKEVAAVLPGLADALSKLKDEDADFVLFGLLSVVKQEQSNGLGWANVVVGKTLMFNDISMPDLIKLAFKSGQHNFQDFLSAPPQASPGAQ